MAAGASAGNSSGGGDGGLQGRRVNFGGFTGELPPDWSTANTPDKLIISRTSGFRADSRWVGVGLWAGEVSDGGHTLFAVTENGYLYVARDARLLAAGVAKS